MKFCYDKLWRVLDERGMSKRALCKRAGICLESIARITRQESVSTDILLRICGCLHCGIGDIMEFVPDEQ